MLDMLCPDPSCPDATVRNHQNGTNFTLSKLGVDESLPVRLAYAWADLYSTLRWCTMHEKQCEKQGQNHNQDQTRLCCCSTAPPAPKWEEQKL